MKKKNSNVARKIGFGMLMAGSIVFSAGTSISELGKELSINSFAVRRVTAEEGGSSSHKVLKTNLYFDDDTASVDESDTYGYKWDKATKTLTLSGFNMVTGKCPALELPTGSTIYLEKNTENAITLEDHAVTQSTPGGYELGNARATAGIYIGDGTKASTVNIVGYGSLNTTVGHMDDEMVAMGTAAYKIRYTFGVCGNIVVGNEAGTDSPKVDIIVTDDVLNFTLNEVNYTTGIQVLRTGCGFTLNNGNLHMKAGKANQGVIMFQPSQMIYNKGKIVFEISKESNTSFICYGSATEITNSKKLPITVKDENGNDLTFNPSAGVYNSVNGKAYYVIIDISKQIILESKTGGMQVGKAGEVTLDYSTVNLEDGDTVGIEYYDPSLGKYTTGLPAGMSKEIDTTNKKIKLITEGKTLEGTYQFRLVLTASSTYDYQTFYSNDFNFIVGFEPTGNEYDSGDYKLEESDNPEKINEAITITASEGYKVSSDGENYSDSATFNEESTKKNPKVHASLFIKRESDDSVSTVEFDYSLDTTSPTATFGSKSSYITPNEEKLVNEKQTIFLSNIDDSLSENANIKKEYVILSEKLSEDDLKAKDKELAWTAVSTDDDGNYAVDIDGNDKEIKVAYIKLTDEAGNVTYLASDAYSFDKTAPAVTGLDENKNYYLTASFTVDDAKATVTCVASSSETPITLEKDSDGKYILPGNVDETYTITVTDEAGNKTIKTIRMNPISSLSSSIASLTEDNVTSANKATIEEVQAIVKDADTTSATASEIAALKEISNSEEGNEGKCEKLLAKLKEISSSIKSISDSLNGKTIDNVKSTDADNLTNIKNAITNLMKDSSSNLTEAEKATLEAQKTNIDLMLSKIEEVKQNLASIKSSVTDLSESNVTSANKEALQKALDKGNALVAGENLTAEEKEEIQPIITKLQTLISKINEVSSKITSIDTSLNGLSESNVTSANKEGIESNVTEIDNLLNGSNLTSEERTVLAAKKANAQKLLEKIKETAEEYKEVKDSINSLDEKEEPTKEELQEAIQKANNLKNSGNLTSEEVSELNQLITKAQDKLDKRDTKVGNLWWLIITLGVVALIEAILIFIKKYKLNKKEKEKITKTNVVALPALAILTSVIYPTGQIVACIVLGVVVVILAVILSIVYIGWNHRKEKKKNEEK